MAKSKRANGRKTENNAPPKGGITKKNAVQVPKSGKDKPPRERAKKKLAEDEVVEIPVTLKPQTGRRSSKSASAATPSYSVVKPKLPVKPRSAADRKSTPLPQPTIQVKANRQTRSSGVQKVPVKPQAVVKSTKRKSVTSEPAHPSTPVLSKKAAVKERAEVAEKAVESLSKTNRDTEETSATTPAKTKKAIPIQPAELTPSRGRRTSTQRNAKTTDTRVTRSSRNETSLLEDEKETQPASQKPIHLVPKRGRPKSVVPSEQEPAVIVPPRTAAEPALAVSQRMPSAKEPFSSKQPVKAESLIVPMENLPYSCPKEQVKMPKQVAPAVTIVPVLKPETTTTSKRRVTLPIEEPKRKRREASVEAAPRTTEPQKISFDIGCQFPEVPEVVILPKAPVVTMDQSTQVGTPFPIPLVIKIEADDNYVIPVINLEPIPESVPESVPEPTVIEPEPIPEPPPRPRPKKVFTKSRGMKEVPCLPADTGPPPKPGAKEYLVPIQIVGSLKSNGAPKAQVPVKPAKPEVEDLTIPTPLFNLDDLNLAGEVELISDEPAPVCTHPPQSSTRNVPRSPPRSPPRKPVPGKIIITEENYPGTPRKPEPQARTYVRIPNVGEKLTSPRKDKWPHTPPKKFPTSGGSSLSPDKLSPRKNFKGFQHQPQLVSELVTNMIKANLPISPPTMDAVEEDSEDEEELLDLDDSPSNYFNNHSPPKPPPRPPVTSSNKDYVIFHASVITTNGKAKSAVPESFKRLGMMDESEEEDVSDTDVGSEFNNFKPLPCNSASNGTLEKVSSCRSRIQKVRDKMKQKSHDKQEETDSKTPPIFRYEIYPLKKPPSVKDIMDWKRKLTPEQEYENAQRVPSLRFFLNKSNPVKYPLQPGDDPRKNAIKEMLEAVRRIRAATEEMDRKRASENQASGSVILPIVDEPEIDTETRRRSIRWKSPMVASKVIPDQYTVPLDSTRNGEEYSIYLPNHGSDEVVVEAKVTATMPPKEPDLEADGHDTAIPNGLGENGPAANGKTAIELAENGDEEDDSQDEDGQSQSASTSMDEESDEADKSTSSEGTTTEEESP